MEEWTDKQPRKQTVHLITSVQTAIMQENAFSIAVLSPPHIARPFIFSIILLVALPFLPVYLPSLNELNSAPPNVLNHVMA